MSTSGVGVEYVRWYKVSFVESLGCALEFLGNVVACCPVRVGFRACPNIAIVVTAYVKCVQAGLSVDEIVMINYCKPNTPAVLTILMFYATLQVIIGLLLLLRYVMPLASKSV